MKCNDDEYAVKKVSGSRSGGGEGKKSTRLGVVKKATVCELLEPSGLGMTFCLGDHMGKGEWMKRWTLGRGVCGSEQRINASTSHVKRTVCQPCFGSTLHERLTYGRYIWQPLFGSSARARRIKKERSQHNSEAMQTLVDRPRVETFFCKRKDRVFLQAIGVRIMPSHTLTRRARAGALRASVMSEPPTLWGKMMGAAMCRLINGTRREGYYSLSRLREILVAQ